MSMQILSEYLEYLEIERGLADNTVEAYRRDLSYFLDICNCELENIQRSHINNFILNLRENNYSATSVMRKIASLRGFFKWLCTNEYCKNDPTLTLEQPKVPKKLPKVISLQVGASFENLKGFKPYFFVTTSVDVILFAGLFGILTNY